MFVTIKSKLMLSIGIFSLFSIVQVVVIWLNTAENIATGNEITHVLQPTQGKLHLLEMNVVQIQQWLTDISATRALDGLNDGIEKATENHVLALEHISDVVNQN